MLRLLCCLAEVLTSNLEQGRRQQDGARSGRSAELKINNAGPPSHHTTHTTPPHRRVCSVNKQGNATHKIEDARKKRKTPVSGE